MKPINNFANVQATTGEFNRPSAGGYCVEILEVKDFPMNAQTGKGDYLKIDYDICHGEFAGYYTKQNERFGGTWFANFIRSYKESAVGMFKHFINCVEESNKGYKWNWEENSLVGKYVGVVIGEEEYLKSDGTVGVRLAVKEIKTIDQIVNGQFKVPAIKKLAGTVNTSPIVSTPKFTELEDDETLPF